MSSWGFLAVCAAVWAVGITLGAGCTEWRLRHRYDYEWSYLFQVAQEIYGALGHDRVVGMSDNQLLRHIEYQRWRYRLGLSDAFRVHTVIRGMVAPWREA